MLRKNNINLWFAIVLCIVFVGFTAQNAMGSAWIGEDGGSSSSGGGSGSHRDCKNYPKAWNNAECNGAAWVYYQYVKGSHDNESVAFAPGKRSTRIIPGDCARSDKENYGFWHLGFYVEFNGKHNPYTSGYLSDTLGGVYGTDYLADVGYALTTSHGTLNYGWRHRGSSFYIESGKELSHTILKDGTAMYVASIYGPDWSGNGSKGYSVQSVYEKTVDLYNELNGTSLSHNPGNGLWAFCSTPDGEGGGATISGTITATINGAPKANNSTHEATDDVTVINYTDTVFTNNNTTHNVQICYSGSDNYGNQSSYTACHYYTPSDTSDSKQPSISVNTPEGMSAVTVCHYLDHPTNINSDGVVSGSKRETHCVKITRKAPEPKGCGDMGITYDDYTAYTDAQMIFKFNDNSTTLGYNGSGNSKTEWAKPGDNVQYEYKMCGSSEYARLASHDEPAKGFGSSDVPKFDLSANKNGTSNSRYLFGHTPTSYTSSNLTNYYVNFTSPDTTYTCTYAGGKATKTKFYQIPAESGASCKSATDVAQYSDVGSTFEQKLQYRKVSTRKYSKSYTGSYTTSSCNASGVCTTTTHYYTYYQYGTELASSSNQTLTGTVKVPYNYALVPYMKHSSSDGITYAGASFNTQAYIATIPRVNTKVQSTAYATRTKNTRIIVASFTMTGSSMPISEGKSSTSGSIDASKVCSVASGGNRTENCKSVYDNTSVLNQTNNMLSGSSDESQAIASGGSNVNSTITSEVPYVNPGTKFCVAVGVSPADSHNTGDNRNITDDSQTAALSSTGQGYRVGPPACVTVAKKPTFSVESSQLVTKGNISTSITNANSRIYGSWTEYGVVAGGTISNMGSGAAYGYTSPYYNVGRYEANKGTASAGLPKTATSACSYSQQTYGNISCTLGSATIINNSVNERAVADKVREIYYMTKSEMNEGYDVAYGMKDLADASSYYTVSTGPINISGFTGGSFRRLSFGSSEACQYSSSRGRYIAPSANSRTYPSAYAMVGSQKVSSVYCTATGEKYWKSTANMYLTGTSSAMSNMQMGGSGTSDLDHTGGTVKETYRNPVYIIDATDRTIVIDVNIEASNGSQGDRFQAIDQIPTAIIFAKDVIITDRVSRLDAWIIASGTVNTCGAVGYMGKIINSSDLTSDICNTQLEINGAVYANKIILNRTYGGGGQGSDNADTVKSRFVQRGEIINLRSDVYYWAYYQSQRNRILTTVYARELPVRY